jgi:hypothetical protein
MTLFLLSSQADDVLCHAGLHAQCSTALCGAMQLHAVSCCSPSNLKVLTSRQTNKQPDDGQRVRNASLNV